MFPKNCKILIIDDMKTMRMVMKKHLKTIGFADITEADDGATAWPLIEMAASGGAPFQLILSDWNMPQMQGIDLLKKVRAHNSLKKSPFIMVTAETEKTQIMEAIKAGVSNYLMKPFTVESLTERLEQTYKKINQA